MYTVAVAAFFGVLVLTGTTMSSLGIEQLRVDGALDHGGMIGTPRAIRSDEYLRTSLWRIGALKDRDTSFETPLGADGELLTAMVTDGVVSRFVLAESFIADLGRVLPDSVVYALLWWAPSLLFWLFGPRLFVAFGMTFSIAVGTAALIWFAPAVMWWSIGPVNSGFATSIPASLLLLVASRAIAVDGGRRRLLVVLTSCAVAGLLIARIPFAYAPWAVPTSVGVLLPTAFVAVRRDGWRSAIRVFGLAGVGAALALVLTVLEHRVGFETLRETVYPGARRSTARAVDIGFLFGAPHLAVLRSSSQIVATNASEISSAMTILAVPALLFGFATVDDWKRRLSPAWWGLAATFGALFCWVTVDLPIAVGQRLPGISLVPPGRTATVIGFVAAIWFGVTLGLLRALPSSSRFRIGVGSAVVVILILTAAGSSLRGHFLPGLTEPEVIRNSLLTAAGVGVAIAFAQRWWSSLPLVAFVLALAVGVNPLIVGLGDLRSSTTARTVRRLDGEVGGYWITNSMFVDGLLIANAIPSLSGQQWAGPDERAWRKLDPSGSARAQWNRGVAFVTFDFDTAATSPQISSPVPDVVNVIVDPCDRRLTALGVRMVASTVPLDGQCLVAAGTVRWGGTPTHLYKRRDASE